MLYENCDIHTIRTNWSQFKGIVSRDFLCLQMILMDRLGIPDFLLKVYFFKFTFSYCFLSFEFTRVKLLL